MARTWKILIHAVAIALVLLLFTEAEARNGRNFPMPDSPVTDFTGTIFSADLETIRRAIMDSRERNGMDGMVIVALSTDEWHLQEYAKDYCDFLRGKGLISSSGWLIYVSTADKKFAIAPQDKAKESFTQQRLSEIMLIMSERLEQDDISGAIINAIKAIGDLSGPQTVMQKKRMSPDMLIFMGIAVIVVVLMIRLRQIKLGPQKAKM